MMKIEYSNKFRKDYKRELKGQYSKTFERDFMKVLDLLVSKQPLPVKYQDHPLSGNLKGYRDCHIRPDLVLIYKIETSVLTLVRVGSHSELF